MEAAGRLMLEGVEPYIGDAASEFFSWSSEQVSQFVNNAALLGVAVPSVCVGLFNGDDAIIRSEGFEKAVRLTSDALKFSAASASAAAPRTVASAAS